MSIDFIDAVALISLLTMFTVPTQSIATSYNKPKLMKLSQYMSITLIIIGVVSLITILFLKINHESTIIIPFGFLMAGTVPQILYHTTFKRIWNKNQIKK